MGYAIKMYALNKKNRIFPDAGLTLSTIKFYASCFKFRISRTKSFRMRYEKNNAITSIMMNAMIDMYVIIHALRIIILVRPFQQRPRQLIHNRGSPRVPWFQRRRQDMLGEQRTLHHSMQRAIVKINGNLKISIRTNIKISTMKINENVFGRPM